MKQIETRELHEWRDDGKGGIKPVVVTYEIKEKADAHDILIYRSEEDWVPEDDITPKN
jgi:hypothetical protein